MKPRPILVNSEPDAIGQTTRSGRRPAELLDRLVGEGLRALRVVGAQVDVDERPRALLAELGAEPVDVVVVAADADQVRPVDAGGEELLLLEVGGHEDVGVEARRGRVRGDGVGEVAGRGAGDRLEAQLLRLRDGDRDDPVLERMGRVGGVVLDPELAEAEALGQAVGADQRRQPRLERIARALRERQEVGIAPDPGGPGLDLPLELGGVGAAEVVGDLQRAEARLADVAGVERVLGPALLALRGPWVPYVSDLQSGRSNEKDLCLCEQRS